MIPEKPLLDILWQKFVHWLPYTVVALIGVTSTAAYQSIGIVALGFVWLILIIVGIAFYAFRKQRECKALKKEAEATSHISTSDSEARSRIGELEGQISVLRKDANSVKAQNVQFTKDIEEWKSKARKLEEESQVMKMTLAKPAQATSEMPRKQQADNVIIETEIAIPPRDDYEVTSKEIKRGEIEILAQSRSSAAFTFLLLDSTNMKRYVQGYSNWEPVLIKPNVSYFKERVKIPRADAWFFIVERTVKDDPTSVRILVTLTG